VCLSVCVGGRARAGRRVGVRGSRVISILEGSDCESTDSEGEGGEIKAAAVSSKQQKKKRGVRRSASVVASAVEQKRTAQRELAEAVYHGQRKAPRGRKSSAYLERWDELEAAEVT